LSSNSSIAKKKKKKSKKQINNKNKLWQKILTIWGNFIFHFGNTGVKLRTSYLPGRLPLEPHSQPFFCYRYSWILGEVSRIHASARLNLDLPTYAPFVDGMTGAHHCVQLSLRQGLGCP
jgi:hypothetical protein